MKKTIGRFLETSIAIGLMSLCMIAFVQAEETKHEHGAGAKMEMHHMHMMMNHGLEMIMEGSNLVMLAEMKMSPDLDPTTLSHGRAMIEQGKGMIKHMLSGPEMEAMHKSGHGSTSLMEYTHALAAAMLKVTDMFETMKMDDMKPADTMTMHLMHILISHALEMAAEGSNLVMLGQVGMADSIDKHSIEHGKMMLIDAKALIKEVMNGKAMTQMHTREAGKSTEMDYTHKLAAAAEDLVDLLGKMEQVK